MQGREFAGGMGYRWGFGGQKSIFVFGQLYDYLFRTLDARLCRFISVDPLLAVYPSNTPFAFAENRAIDCIDLEGKEVYRSTHYNIFTNEFQVKITLVCYTDIEDMNMSFIEQQHLRNLLVTRFSEAFAGVQDSRRRISFSGEIQFTETAKYGINYYSSVKDESRGGPQVLSAQGEVNTYDNVIPVPTSTFYSKSSELRKRSIASIVRTTIHEWGHSVGLNHPFEVHKDDAAHDVQLTRIPGSLDHFTMPSMNYKYIEKNAMMYYDKKVYINGMNLVDRVGELNKNRMVKFSPDQVQVILNTINSDENRKEE